MELDVSIDSASGELILDISDIRRTALQIAGVRKRVRRYGWELPNFVANNGKKTTISGISWGDIASPTDA